MTRWQFMLEATEFCIFMSICIYALIAALCLALVFFEASQGVLWVA